ncbi:MAG: DNA polymerase III subunit epsilon [Pseudomonadales bacterium]|jgi:DNA polymerase-3 subunit epsilon
MRQVVLDTETTGLEAELGHRILEVGCVELIGRKITRRHFHHYINPEREIDDGALEVHGITQQFLSDKPVFADVWEQFLEFVDGAELIIHNAAFDIAFINQEMKLISPSLGVITDYCTVIDSLALARNKHPGQKNNLDALCKRYSVDNTQRDLHGALLDAEILADVYLLLTGGQVTLSLGVENENNGSGPIKRELVDRKPLRIIRAGEQELVMHDKKLEMLEGLSETGCLWKKMESEA